MRSPHLRLDLEGLAAPGSRSLFHRFCQSKHDPLSFESILAVRRVSHLVPENVPVILESRVDQDGIDDEIENARKALSVEDVRALTGD
jgi:hypothetical protein